MRLRLSDCVHSKSPAAGDAKAACVAGYAQSFEEDLNLEESKEKELPWLVRLLTSSKVLDSRHMQYGQARFRLATARAHIENGKTDSAVDEILLARKISADADEEYSGELRRSIDKGSGAAKVLLATGTSLVVIGTAGGAAAYVGGGAAAVYGTSTVGGLLATMGFSTLAGANGGLLAGAVLAGTRSLVMGDSYIYSTDEQFQYAIFGGSVGLLQGSFPFAVRTGIGWARGIHPGAGGRGTVQAVAKKAVELTPVAMMQGAISAAQVKISGGSNSEVMAGATMGAAIPFVYSGMMVAFGLPANLKVLTWRDPRFPNEYARVIFYDGVERPYQVYSYTVVEGGQPPQPRIKISAAKGVSMTRFSLNTHRVKTADGIGISVYEKVPPQLAEKPKAILLIHSATFSSLPEFDLRIGDYSLMNFLAGKGFHVFALDIRGYGGSDRPLPETWVTADVAVNDVSAAINFITQRLDAPSVSLLGWSWGTQVAGLYAQRYPDSVARLILYAPFWNRVNTGIPEPSGTRSENTPEGAVGDFLDPARVEPAVKAEFARQCMLRDRTSPAGSWRDLRSLGNMPVLNPGEIKTPVLVIYGEDDHLIVKSDIDAFYRSLGTNKKRLVVISNADHMAHLEKNHDVFNSAVDEFLGR